MHFLGSMGTAWTNRLFARVDITALVYFRIVFGGIMAWEVVRFIQNGWISRYFIQPKFHFTYFGFGWVHPLPGLGMYWLFGVLGLLSLCILFGLAYRLSAALFFAGFTYAFLVDEARYLNHFYFVCLLSFLAIFVPAHWKFSVDAMLRPGIASEQAPAWTLWMLRAQMGIVYFYGGVAKLNADWVQGWPLRLWLGENFDLPILWRYRGEPWLAIGMSYAGLAMDLLAVPLLLWRRTRWPMFTVLALFHLTNATIFDIGIFPWLSLAATALFFAPDWPRRAVEFARIRLPGGKRFDEAVEAPREDPPRYRKATLVALAVYFAFQVFIPLRHWLYPGPVAWSEEGHRFSWRMKLRDKGGNISFTISNPETGESRSVELARYLDDWQISAMGPRPDMVLQFANYLADRETQPGHRRVEVRANLKVSLNGRKARHLIDPMVNLAAEKETLFSAPWILPFSNPPR